MYKKKRGVGGAEREGGISGVPNTHHGPSQAFLSYVLYTKAMATTLYAKFPHSFNGHHSVTFSTTTCSKKVKRFDNYFIR